MIRAYKRPNFAASYNGYQHDVSFTLDCDGLTVAPGWRLGTFGKEKLCNVVSALDLNIATIRRRVHAELDTACR